MSHKQHPNWTQPQQGIYSHERFFFYDIFALKIAVDAVVVKKEGYMGFMGGYKKYKQNINCKVNSRSVYVN